MPTKRAYDFKLGGQGYMLARVGFDPERGHPGARAWHRTGIPDTPGQRSVVDARYGELPDEIDRPEVWDDWSSGMGYAYRPTDPGLRNSYHWSENFDPRFPKQLIHAQRLKQLPSALIASMSIVGAGDPHTHIDVFLDIQGYPATRKLAGHHALLLLGHNNQARLVPDPLSNEGPDTNASAFYAPSNVLGVAGIADDFCGRPAVFGSYIFIGNNDDTFFIDTLANALGFDSPVGFRGKGFTNVGNRLWRYHDGTTVGVTQRRAYVAQLAAEATAVNPLNWAPSGGYMVGNGQSEINDIIGHEGQVYVGTSDLLYVGDNTGTFPGAAVGVAGVGQNEYQMGNLGAGANAHYDNWRDLSIWNNQVVGQTISGLHAYHHSTETAIMRDITPPLPAKTPLAGRYRTTQAFGQWLITGLTTGSQSYLIAGRDGGERGMVWHSLNRLPHPSRIHRTHIDGITTASGGQTMPQRLWVSTDWSISAALTAALYYQPIPMNFGNPLTPQVAFSANYVGSARMDFGEVNWAAPGTPKALRLLEVWAENLASTAAGPVQYCDVYYTVDGGTRTLLGRAIDSPRSDLYFPTTVTGQAFALSIESFTHSYGVTPIYRSFVLRGTARPNSADVITAQVRVGDHLRNRVNTPIRRSAKAMMTHLRALADQDEPTTLVDLTGATHYVNVLQPVDEQEVWQGDDVTEVVAQIKMAIQRYAP